MTTTTAHSHPDRLRKRFIRRLGFTLSEIAIATFLFGIVSAGTLQSFLLFSKNSLSSRQYAEMESEARKSLEIFARDARGASSIAWTSTDDLTLTVPSESSGTPFTYTVRYRYLNDSYSTASLRKTFSRQILGTTPSGYMTVETTPTALVNGVSTFSFFRYKLGAENQLAANNLETKQLEVALTAERKSVSTAKATNIVVSARFVLRNKVVSN